MTRKIGKYDLGKTIGVGTFSKVKEAVDPETGMLYAVKVIDKEQLEREHMEEQLKREIAVLKVLRHPNVVMMKEVLQTPKHIYMVLELVSGGELFDHITEAKRFEEPLARKYFQQMMMGVRYCHQNQIAHRDLKPENLLLDATGVLKISDFGLSNLQKQPATPGPGNAGMQMMHTVCGTPNYVAPEVLKEKGYNGCIADLWSCGVILFVMLAGYLPFDDPNLNALFNKIERGDYRIPRHFSEGAKDLIAKLICVDPTKRVTIDQIIAHPWFQEGFDPKLLENPLIQITAEQIRGAVTDAVEDVSAATGPDAFSLIPTMLAGTLMPLTGAAMGISHGQSRRVFSFKGSSAETVKEVTTALSQMKANPRPYREGEPEIKGFFNAAGGLMTYVIIVLPTIVAELCFVDVRRGRGDVAQFHSFVTSLRGALPEGSVRSQDLPFPE